MRTLLNILIVLAIAFSAATPAAHATESSIDEILAIQAQGEVQDRQTLAKFKADLLEMQNALENDHAHFVASRARWIRNLSLGIAAFASVAAIHQSKSVRKSSFVVTLLISGAASLLVSLSQNGIVLSDEQVAELKAKVSELLKVAVELEGSYK